MLQSATAWGHNSFTLNEHIGATGTIDITKVNNTVVIDEREFETTFRDGRDPFHLAQGGALGRVHKGLLYARLRGRILVPDATQIKALADRERAMRAAFDPDLCENDSPATEGAYALDWNEPTEDVNFATGLIPIRLYARPVLHPLIRESLKDRTARTFALSLVTGDPRFYHQTESTLALSPASASGNVINRGSVPSALKATIVMSGAGHASFTITRGGVAFVLNLSTMVNTDTVVVIFETCGPYGRGKLITKNGTENFALKTSAADTWLTAPVGTTSFVISNHTNVTSCTLAWRHAWA